MPDEGGAVPTPPRPRPPRPDTLARQPDRVDHHVVGLRRAHHVVKADGAAAHRVVHPVGEHEDDATE